MRLRANPAVFSFVVAVVWSIGCGGGGGGGGKSGPTRVAASVSATRSTAVASPAAGLPRNGFATATITVTVVDATGEPIADQRVSLAASGTGATIVGPSGPTDARGVAVGSVASTVAERKTITVTVNPGPDEVVLDARPTVEFSAATEIAFVGGPGDADAGAAIPAVEVTVKDGSGQTVTTADTAITVAIAGGGTLSGTLTRRSVNGVATFSDLRITEVRAGYRLIATAAGFLPSAPSGAFDVGPASAAALFVTVEPTDAVSEVAIAPTIEVVVRDAFGNTATTFADPVTITLGPNANGATLIGTVSKRPGPVPGVVTFSNLSVDKEGAGYTLVASAAGLTSATSDPFAVSAGLPARLKFEYLTPPHAFETAGVPVPPIRVTVVDAGGNVAVGSAGPISIVIVGTPRGADSQPVPPVLLGAVTLTASPANVVTFTDVAVKYEGSGYRLGASAAGIPPQPTGSFAVKAGPYTDIAFEADPTSVFQGYAMGATVLVTDAFGNRDIFQQNPPASVTLGAVDANGQSVPLSGKTTRSTTAGLASFDGLRLSAPGGEYRLVATGPGLAPATSDPFDILELVQLTSFTSDPARPEIGETATLSWAFQGTPGPVTLDQTLDPGPVTVTGVSKDLVPLETLPPGPDPRAGLRLHAGIPGIAGDVVEIAKAVRAGGPYQDDVWTDALPDGGVVFSGTIFVQTTLDPDGTPLDLYANTTYEAYVVRLRPDLSVDWVRRAHAPGTNAFSRVAGAPDGGAVVLGFYYGQLVFGPDDAPDLVLPGDDSFYNLVVARYGPDGTLRWARRVRGAGAPQADAVAALPDGGAIVLGRNFGTGTVFGPDDPIPVSLPYFGNENLFVARYAPDGSVLWAKAIGEGGAASVYVNGGNIAALPDGGALVTGRINYFGTPVTIGFDGTNPVTIAPTAGFATGFVARFRPDGTVAWARRAEGAIVNGIAVAALPDEGAIVTGVFTDDITFGIEDGAPLSLPVSTNHSDVYVARYAPDGTFLWAKGTTGLYAQIRYPTDIAAFPDGSAVVSGIMDSTTTFGTITVPVPQGERAGFVAAYAPDGTVLWADRIDATEVYFTSVGAYADGKFVLGGSYRGNVTLAPDGLAETFPPVGSDFDLFFGKYAPVNYRLLELRPAGLASAIVLGGADDDAGRAVAASPDGSSITTGSRGADLFVARRLADGTVPSDWQDVAVPDGAGRAIAPCLGGGAVVAGDVGGDLFVARYRADGSTVWSRNDLGAGEGRGVGVAADGSAIAVAFASSTTSLCRFAAADGTVLFEKQIVGASVNGVAVYPDGGFVVVGSFSTSATFAPEGACPVSLTASSEDLFVARYRPDGTLAWVKQAGEAAVDRALGVAVGPDDEILVTGVSFSTDVTFEDGGTTLPYPGSGDVFVARLDPDGHLVWAGSAGGEGLDTGTAVAVVADGRAAVTGSFHGDAAFGGTTLSATGGASDEDVFLVAYDPADGSIAWAKQAGGAGPDAGVGIAAFSDRSVVLTGRFQSTPATFGPGEASATEASASGGGDDIFVASYYPYASPATFAPLTPAPPANDDIAQATCLPGLPFEEVVKLGVATPDASDPGACSTAERTVWYAFTPASDVSARAWMPHDFAGVVAVYTGTPGALSSVTCAPHLVTFDATAGVTYYLKIEAPPGIPVGRVLVRVDDGTGGYSVPPS